MKKKALRRTALLVLASVLALFALSSPAAAQDGPMITIDPAVVPAEGEYEFTVTGSGFTVPGVAVLPCTAPGDVIMTPDMSAAELEALMRAAQPTGGDCIVTGMVQAPVGADGTFTVQVTGTVGPNFFVAAGDLAQTETAGIPVFVVMEDMDDMGDGDMDGDMDDMGDDMAPDGGADTGFGGMAGSDSTVPLTAALAAVVLLGGTALIARRIN